MDGKRDDLWTGVDTLRQLRIHFLLEEHFRLSRAVRPRLPRGLKASAAFLLAVGVAVVVRQYALRPTGPCLRVEPVEAVTLTQEELELCRARYSANRSFAHAVRPEIMKYEPGTIANPGAAIEVLEASSAASGHHLHAGDRVWRQELVLPSGRLRFSVGDGCVVTAVGPAKVRLPDAATVEVVAGNVFVDAHQRINIQVAGQSLAVAEASVGVVVRSDGRSADLLVTDGLVLLDRDICLKPCDGVRLDADGSRRRYRSLMDGGSLRETLLAGVSEVRISERKQHAL